jgi:hypothetical protein
MLRNTEKRPITWKRDAGLFVAHALTNAFGSIGNYLHDEN